MNKDENLEIALAIAPKKYLTQWQLNYHRPFDWYVTYPFGLSDIKKEENKPALNSILHRKGRQQN